jgi:hypothetical protein
VKTVAWPVPLGLLLLAACGSLTSGGEPPLPPSIEATVRSMYPDHHVVYCETRTSPADGPVHRVTLDRDGRRTWVLLDDRGGVLRERAEITEAEVPLQILGTVRKQMPDARIPLAIRWREDGTTRYELRILDPSGLTSTLEITPAGMIVEDIDGEGHPGEDG